jgi:hypothetical protein
LLQTEPERLAATGAAQNEPGQVSPKKKRTPSEKRQCADEDGEPLFTKRTQLILRVHPQAGKIIKNRKDDFYPQRLKTQYRRKI